MKRSSVAGLDRIVLAHGRRDVAGGAPAPTSQEVASFHLLHVHARLHDHRTRSQTLGSALDDWGRRVPDAETLRIQFADFMAGDAQLASGELPAPDPQFRERLRRRLWRTHVMSHRRDGGETH